MASEDVIELGSSDDEAEPAPKKKKPMPNAMVHIPSKLPENSMKQAKAIPATISRITKPVIKKVNTTKGNLSSSIPIQKTSVSNNPSVVKNIFNPIPVRMPGVKNFSGNMKSLPLPLAINQKLILDQPKNKKIVNKRVQNPMATKQKPRLPLNLPPGITIKHLPKAGISGVNKKYERKLPGTSYKPHVKSSIIGEVLTVEIDDEEVIESLSSSPQWYLRPGEERHDPTNDDIITSDNENHNRELTIKEQNNKEPETPKFVEITIEDSPVKPLHLKHTEIGKELTITIDDSPVKPVTNCNKEESDTEQYIDKIPQSKRKLSYPKENNMQQRVVEIEIDLMQTDIDPSDNSKEESTKEENTNEENEKEENTNEENTNEENTKQELSCVESSIQEVQETRKEILAIEKDQKSKDSNNDVCVVETKDKANDEFHPVYQKFIGLCFELENSDDMKKIVDKKIKAYYKQCPKEYVESEEFIEMVSSKIISMKASPEKMYLYIKDVVDELNLQRKMKKIEVKKKEVFEKDTSRDTYGEKSEYDDKRHRQIRKLEKTIKKLHRAIQKLEEQEVDFDDDEDSVYLLTERYKERMVRVHEKLCQMTNTKMPSEPRIHIEARPGQPKGPAKKLEIWVNKKVPIGKPLPFPDFHDVVRCVREANNEDRLGWNENDIMEEARDLFTRCGKKLQRRRQENEWRIASSRVTHHIDPAECSTDLKKRLDENKSLAAKKETEVFNKYADRQNQLQLEAVEIGDKEAEESPVESEEEEDLVEETDSLEVKQKRKEKIKQLLKDKSKNNEEKENNPLPAENMNIENESKEDKTDRAIKDSKNVNTEEPLDNKQNSNNVEKVIAIDKETTESYSYDVMSGTDQLNLLSEMYTENEDRGVTSSSESSDSDSSITISDTSESNDEADKRPIVLSDVISIENSSYSENESIDEVKDEEVTCLTNPIVEDVAVPFDAECSTTPIENNTEEIENDVDNILLGSSEEDNTSLVAENDITCINLKDDSISITETMLVGDVTEKECINNNETVNALNQDAEGEVGCINLKNNNIFITETMVDETGEEAIINNEENIQENKYIESLLEEPMELSEENTETDVIELSHETEINESLYDDVIRNTVDLNSIESSDLKPKVQESTKRATNINSLEESSNAELRDLNEKNEETKQNKVIINTTSNNMTQSINCMET